MLPREKVFQRLWSPEVMYILMLLAIYGIIGELSNPGTILPAVVGGIALILALFMASVLPVNATGVALIVLAVILFIADIFAPTHGVLTGGGIISFLFGSMMLFNTAGSAFHLSLALIIPATIVSAAFFVYVFGAGLRRSFCRQDRKGSAGRKNSRSAYRRSPRSPARFLWKGSTGTRSATCRLTKGKQSRSLQCMA